MKFLFLVITMMSGFATAAPNPKAMEKKSSSAEGNASAMNFEDMLVQGKYHFSDEAVTTVEQDKILDSLLGIRKDFKDRIRKSASQQ